MNLRRLTPAVALFSILAVGGSISPARATLIVFFPTKVGIVAAADSEIRLRGRIVPNVEKIRFVPKRADVAFVVTMHAVIYHPRFLSDDSPQAHETAERLWDSKQIIADFIGDEPANAAIRFAELCDRVRNSLSAFLTAHPEFRGVLKPNDTVCRIAVVQFDPVLKRCTIEDGAIILDPMGTPRAQDFHAHHLSPSDKSDPVCYGVVDDMIKALRGPDAGRLLPAEFWPTINVEKTIAERTVVDAAFLASAMIKGTSAAAGPTPTAEEWRLGGEPRIYLISGTKAPEKIDVRASRSAEPN